ncbi:MAG: 50S ribosomal protein L10 [Thermomicrobiales bacterium]|nr:50S ribosomal protein L10 [Thermomicrobiales bacterium]
MPTIKKAYTIRDLSKSLKSSQLTVICDYRGLSVAQLQQLRTNLRPHGAQFSVAKNTLVGIAAKRNGIEGLDQYLEGPSGVVMVEGDIVQAAKVLNDFVRTSRILTIKGGLLGEAVISAADVEAVASLPSREELYGKVVNLLASPMVRTLGVFSGPSRSLAYLLNARQEQISGAAD